RCQSKQTFRSFILDQIFHSGFVSLCTLTVPVECPDQPFSKRNKLIDRKELVDEIGVIGLCSQTTCDQDLETMNLLTIFYSDPGNQSDVVDVAVVIIVFSCRKRNFKFPPHILADWIPDQAFKRGLGVGSDIKRSIGMHSCQV